MPRGDKSKYTDKQVRKAEHSGVHGKELNKVFKRARKS